MKKKTFLAALAALLLSVIVLTGCSSSGVPQSQYDQQSAQLADVQSKLAKAQTDLAAAETDQAALTTAQELVIDLQKEVAVFKAKYEFTGLTTAQVSAQIVKNYHETHTYSVTDLFVCTDMAAEVWNLLKTQGIHAIMAVGNVSQAVTDMALSTHAWVLAEVSPGEYLALETTGGNTVDKSQNILYYRGWTFNSPGDIKDYQKLIVQYNEGVNFRNLLADEENRATDQAVQDELDKLRIEKEADLNSIRAKFEALGTVLQ